MPAVHDADARRGRKLGPVTRTSHPFEVVAEKCVYLWLEEKKESVVNSKSDVLRKSDISIAMPNATSIRKGRR